MLEWTMVFPYMKGKYFPKTVNKDVPICCKRSLVAVVENVLTIQKLEKVFGYKPTEVFRKEITELGLDPSVVNVLIHNHETDEKYLKESIQQEENISYADEFFYKDIGEIVKKNLEQDFEKIIDNTGKLMLSQKKEAEDATTTLKQEEDKNESFYSQLSSAITDVFGEVKKLGSAILEKTIEIMKKGARWLFLNCGPFVMALKWLCDKIKVGLCIGVSGKLINDELSLYYKGIYEQYQKIWDEPTEHKELTCDQNCEKKYNDTINDIKQKFPKSAKRDEEAQKPIKIPISSNIDATLVLGIEYAENPDDDEAEEIYQSDRLYNESKQKAEKDRARCQMVCKGKAYIYPILTPPPPAMPTPISPTQQIQQQLSKQTQLLQDIGQRISTTQTQPRPPSNPLKSGGRPTPAVGPLSEQAAKKYLAKQTEKQKEEEIENNLMWNRLGRLQNSDIANLVQSSAIASGKEVFSRLSQDASVSTIKTIASEKWTSGKGLLRDKITNIYFQMKERISNLPSFIQYTLFSTTSYFQKTFNKVWHDLVIILSSILESVVNILTFGLINKLNIPLSETAIIFFDPMEPMISNIIYQKYIFMVQETEANYPNSSVISFFKEWHLCCLDKIKFFDMSDITIVVKTSNNETIQYECKSTDTIESVKVNLHEKLNIPVDQLIVLKFENKELDTEQIINRTLADYEVKNGSTITVTLTPVKEKPVDVAEHFPPSMSKNTYNGGNFRGMTNLYDEYILTKLYQTYKNKRLSKTDKSYLHNILFTILNNVNPANYNQSHKNILFLMVNN